MTSPEPSLQAQRSLFFLAIFAGSLGSCGACGGAANLSDDNYFAADATISAEAAESIQAQAHLLRSDPNRRPLSVGRIVVSVMLMAGGYLLLVRAKSAVWWVRNSLVANMVWAVLDSLSKFFHIRSIAPELRQLMAGGPEPPDGLAIDPYTLANNVLMTGTLYVGIYVYLFWRLSRYERDSEKAA